MIAATIIAPVQFGLSEVYRETISPLRSCDVGGAGKTGGVLLEKVLRGKIENDWVLCPRCKAKLGRLAYGGKVYGYIQKCDRCKSLVQIEVID